MTRLLLAHDPIHTDDALGHSADELRRNVQGRALLLVVDDSEQLLSVLAPVLDALLERERQQLPTVTRESGEAAPGQPTRHLKIVRPEAQVPDACGEGQATAATPPEPARRVANPLSEREQAVLRLVAEGLPNKQIARSLAITERTVKYHVTSILNKLGADNRAQAVALAAQRGLL
jgi:DNA-binding CsgD family transcriptional regulator